MIAYKVVLAYSTGCYMSPVELKNRSPQATPNKGTNLTYEIGEVTKSGLPTPGIYLFRNTKKAREMVSFSLHRILKVRIPVGAKVRMAEGDKLNATAVIPLKLMRSR